MILSPVKFEQNRAFIGRAAEKATLAAMAKSHQASILIVSGRRRSGKTELPQES